VLTRLRQKRLLSGNFLPAVSGVLALFSGHRSFAEDSESLRPYLQLRSAAFNETWGVQDGWGLGIGANLNYYVGFQLDFDAYERKVKWPGLDQIFENSVMSLTPEIRLRYPLAGGKWVPYVFAGPGVTFFQFNDRKDPVFHKEVHGDSTQFSAMFGAGIEYYVADNISFSIEGKYNWINRDPVTVDGERRNIDYSSPLVMFGVRAYFRENHHHPLLQETDKEFPDRFWMGFRYGSSILLDNRMNKDLRLEPVAAALGDTGNQAGSFLLGYNWGKHWSLGLAANYAEYNLASDRYGVIGEYANYMILPEARYRWTLLDGKLSPFVSAGFGIDYSEFNDRKAPGENLKIDSKGIYPAADVGVGAEYFFARNISVSAESHHTTSWNHKIPINGVDEGRGSFSALNLYLGLRFYLIEH
jgi:opacity protein-like surface antigen